MTSFSAFDSSRPAKTAAHSVLPIALSASAIRERNAGAHRTLLPALPSAIPANAASRLPVQRKLAVGAVNDPLESEADAMAAQVLSGAPVASPSAAAAALHRQSSGAAVPSVEAPASVHQALHSPGQPLDATTRASLEPRFGRDLSRVRIHTGPQAAQSAAEVQANAYTVGQDVFFAAGRYNPHSGEGKRLLAHELSHTVQQSGGGSVVQRDPTSQAAATTEQKKKVVTVPLPPDFANRFQLTPPSLLAPPKQPSLFSPGTLSLDKPKTDTSAPIDFSKPLTHPLVPTLQPNLLSPPPLAPYSPASPGLFPPGQGKAPGAPAAAPDAPARIALKDVGDVNLGLRVGMPTASNDSKPGQAPSASAEATKQAEIINYHFTGQPPSAYGLDPGKLVGGIWGIIAYDLAPDLARSIANKVTSKPSTTGVSAQVDLNIILKFPSGSGPTATPFGGGAGATLTVTFP